MLGYKRIDGGGGGGCRRDDVEIIDRANARAHPHFYFVFNSVHCKHPQYILAVVLRAGSPFLIVRSSKNIMDHECFIGPSSPDKWARVVFRRIDAIKIPWYGQRPLNPD